MCGIFLFATGLQQDASLHQPPLPGLKAVLRKQFPIRSALFLSFLCTQRGSLVVFVRFYTAKVLSIKVWTRQHGADRQSTLQRPPWPRMTN